MENTTTQKTEDSNVVLSFRERFCFGLSDLGQEMLQYWVSAFLTIFCTDVAGIPAGAVAALLLSMRFFDAVNDPVIGRLCDKTKSRWGRYRPWVFFSSIGLAASVILMFWAHPGWNSSQKIIYMYVCYMMYSVFTTGCQMSENALGGVLTSDSESRSKAFSMLKMFSFLGMALLGLYAVQLINRVGNGNAAKGYLLVVSAHCVIGMLLKFITFTNTKERVTEPKRKSDLSFVETFKIILKSREAVLIWLGMTVYGMQLFGRMAVLMYYFTYVCNSPGLMSVYALVNGSSNVIGSQTVSFWLKRISNKGKVCSLMLGIAGVCLLAQFAFPASGKAFWILQFLAGISFGAFTPCLISGVSDNVDVIENNYNIRPDGFMLSCQTFFFKCGQALGSSGMLAVLGAVGYAANQPQTPQVVTAINFLATAGCAVCTLIPAGLLLFYRLDTARHAAVLEELKKKRKQQAGE